MKSVLIANVKFRHSASYLTDWTKRFQLIKRFEHGFYIFDWNIEEELHVIVEQSYLFVRLYYPFFGFYLSGFYRVSSVSYVQTLRRVRRIGIRKNEIIKDKKVARRFLNAWNPKDTIRQGFTAWEVKKWSDMYDGLWILYECLNHSLTNVYLDIVLEIISISKILFIVAHSSLRRPQLLFISLKRRYTSNSLNNSVIYATR